MLDYGWDSRGWKMVARSKEDGPNTVKIPSDTKQAITMLTGTSTWETLKVWQEPT